MRQRNVKDQEKVLSESNKYISCLEENVEKIKEIYIQGKYQKIYLEIGMGKGQFILNNAKANPNILYIGIELNRGVVALASKKIKRFEEENKCEINNLIISDYNAQDLEKVFNEFKIDKIFLNFSDPWPKSRHNKRRLTSKTFLDVYKNILKEDGCIEQKTDNRGLIEYSIESFNQNNLEILFISLDLYKDIALGKVVENIPTEYEEKFRDKGPIYKTIVKFKE